MHSQLKEAGDGGLLGEGLIADRWQAGAEVTVGCHEGRVLAQQDLG